MPSIVVRKNPAITLQATGFLKTFGAHQKPDLLTNNSTPNLIENARVVDQNGQIGAKTQYLKIQRLLN